MLPSAASKVNECVPCDAQSESANWSERRVSWNMVKKVVPSFFRKSGATLLNWTCCAFMYRGSHTLNHSSTGVLSLFSRESCMVV